MRYTNSSEGDKRNHQSAYKSIKEILETKNVLQIFFLNVCISFGLGTFGIAPSIISDRFARIYYGHTGPNCFQTSSGDTVSNACRLGSIDAQTKDSWSTLAQYSIQFVVSPLWGALSDRWGRKGFFALLCFVSSFSPVILLLIQVFPSIDPTWYYVANVLSARSSLVGINSVIMSDIVKPDLRVLAFSLSRMFVFLATPLVPAVAARFGYLTSSILVVIFCVIGLILSVTILPETLSSEDKETAIQKRQDELQSGTTFFSTIFQPVKELEILNRNMFLFLASMICCLNEIVKAGERGVFLYFIQGQLGFNANNIAAYMWEFCIATFISNTFLLSKLLQMFGDRQILIWCCIVGTVYNLMYAIIKTKFVVYIGSVMAAFSDLFFAVISSMMVDHVNKHEKGKIQGAVSSVVSLASAIGPFCLNYVFDKTVDGELLGPRTMFFVCAFLFFVATLLSYALPSQKIDRNTLVATPGELKNLLSKTKASFESIV